jgi:Zn-dependent M28 family amino/carboxypeptidase
MIDGEQTMRRLEEHVHHLTVTIGERSVRYPWNLDRTASYIETFYRSIGIPFIREPYRYGDFTVSNIVSTLDFRGHPDRRYVLGAHYDSVAGTVGADDNASAIAVQLETARHLAALLGSGELNLGLSLVSFALEEPPAFATPYMGSAVYARRAREENAQIDGMLCLEMVGYTCRRKGCQGYAFPLMFMGYPKEGNFIGVLGNRRSKGLLRSIRDAFGKNPNLPVETLTVPLNGWVLPATRLSDHASFWDEGYRAVMITDTAFYRNPHYHMPTDTMETLDFGFMAELVRSLVIFFRTVGGG